jgi:hypothetical protein
MNYDDQDDLHAESGESSDLLGRRAALKKAAAAGAVGAAVWAAPKVEGLSVVPNYASAGTGVIANKCFTLTGNGPGILGADNSVSANPSPSQTVVSAGPSDASPVVVSMTLPSANQPTDPIGNVVWTFPGFVDTDGPAIPGGTVVFNIDPPFNKCQIASANVGWTGSTGGLPTLAAPFTPAPIPNTTSPFSQTISIPAGGGPYYNPATAITGITVCIKCT